ncbi:M48 family metallopeptidase [Ottowia sp.]|uniref:M48 family metallopeptidase n=1 Tax=Ottowia sp. TaxID=1898956 RepID=UPI003A8C033B
MKFKYAALAVFSAAVLAGCSATGGKSVLGSSSTDLQVGAAMDVYKSATVSDDELKSTSLAFRKAEDKQMSVASSSSKYAKRLAKLTRKHLNEDGLTLNFKVYITKDINANATPDGSIRFYSGIMDMMTDQELLGIIGHEIGHVKLGHALSATRTAYMASAGRKAASSAGGVAGALSASELGAFGENLLNSQFSQSQETASDDYGLAFMKKHGYDQKAMESAFRKLAKISGKQSTVDAMLSSHPDSAARADRMREKIAAGG